MERCPWCEGFDLYRQYHDTEWGVPHFTTTANYLNCSYLEGAQAGLSWSTVLKKREHYRRVFNGFQSGTHRALQRPEGQPNYWLTLASSGIEPRWLPPFKMPKHFKTIKADGQTFSDFLWHFVDGKPSSKPLAIHGRCAVKDSSVRCNEQSVGLAQVSSLSVQQSAMLSCRLQAW
jgi:DNA-3-methyladenine glycosylase I